MAYTFAAALDNFLTEIDGLSSSLPIIMEEMGKTHRAAAEGVHNFLKRHSTEREEKHDLGQNHDQEGVLYKIHIDNFDELEILRTRAANFTVAAAIMPRTFIMAMISQFDAFVGQVIRATYYSKPELLNASEKHMSFSSLLQLGSLDDARAFIVEKELEAVLRESHIDQFDWIEKKLNMELRTGLDIWPTFVELTERSNLFVHTNGMVSSHYVAVCKKHKVDLEVALKPGDELDVSPEYFWSAYQCLYEIATKLTHVVWRKLIPDEREVADGLLNMVCYRLLKQEKFPLAQKILSFALNLPHHSTHKRKLIFVINKAIAEKFSDNTDYQKTLSDVDWTACSADFQLAVAVLNERFEEAVTIMYRMGRTGLVHKPDYKDWPVFRNFRKTEDFKRAFRAIFSEEIELIEITQGDVIQLIDEEESKSLPESGKNDVIDSQ
jgi:hypothetical protein